MIIDYCLVIILIKTSLNLEDGLNEMLLY